MIAHPGPTAMTNRRSRVLTAAFLIAVAGAAWCRTIEDAHGMSGMLDGFVNAGRTMPWNIGPVGFAGTWTVMMAAMMLPGVIPIVMAANDLRYPSSGVVWALGYLGVWVSTGAIAFGALIALNGMSQPVPAITSSVRGSMRTTRPQAISTAPSTVASAVRRVDAFSPKQTTLTAAIHAIFITPTTRSTDISAHEAPTQRRP